MPETLAQVQSRLETAHTVNGQTRIFFSTPQSHPAGRRKDGTDDDSWPAELRSRLSRVRWFLLDLHAGTDNRVEGQERTGLIDVLDAGSPGEIAWEAGTADNVTSFTRRLEEWLTAYAQRPWDLVLEVGPINPRYRSVVVTVAELNGPVGTRERYAVTFRSGNFQAIKLTNF